MNAYEAALLSKQVYNEYNFCTKNTEGLLIDNDDETIIVFRGTTPNSLADWVSNIRLWPVKYPYGEGKVHHGLLCDVVSILDYIHKVGNKPLYIAGHSRGGGLACVAAKILFDLYQVHTTKVFTFGSMNVGDYTFVKSIEKDIEVLRFTNNDDIVTRLPFLMGIYRGCGKRIHRFADDSIQENPPLCSLVIDYLMTLYNKGWKETILDHNMDLYVNMVQEWQKT